MKAGKPIRIKFVDWVCLKIPQGHIYEADDHLKFKMQNFDYSFTEKEHEVEQKIIDAKYEINASIDRIKQEMKAIDSNYDILNQESANLEWLKQEEAKEEKERDKVYQEMGLLPLTDDF